MRTGHTEDSCYAQTYADGTIIGDSDSDEEDELVEVFFCEYCGKEFDTLKGAAFHENVHCKKKYGRKSYKKSYSNSSSGCYRCGRSGHCASNCYASKHKTGYYL